MDPQQDTTTNQTPVPAGGPPANPPIDADIIPTPSEPVVTTIPEPEPIVPPAPSIDATASFHTMGTDHPVSDTPIPSIPPTIPTPDPTPVTPPLPEPIIEPIETPTTPTPPPTPTDTIISTPTTPPMHADQANPAPITPLTTVTPADSAIPSIPGAPINNDQPVVTAHKRSPVLMVAVIALFMITVGGGVWFMLTTAQSQNAIAPPKSVPIQQKSPSNQMMKKEEPKEVAQPYQNPFATESGYANPFEEPNDAMMEASPSTTQ